MVQSNEPNETNNTPKMSEHSTKATTYSPNVNPLLEATTIPTKNRRVRSNLQERRLLDAETGELTAAAVIHQIEEIDTAQFVKVFAQGIAAAYELNKTAHRAFCAILQIYEAQPMTTGFAEAIHLEWFDGGLAGRHIGMSEKTFKRGLATLLQKQFLAPRTPSSYWVNPALFFKGDRVLFIKEYQRRGLLQRADRRTITLDAKTQDDKK